LSIGERLEIFRESIGVKTRKEFASLIDMKPASYQTYYNDVSVPGGKILIRLAKLGADINHILTGEGAVDREAEARINAKFEKLDNVIKDLKVELFDLRNESVKKDEQIEYLKKEKDFLKKEKEVLLSQVPALNKTVHAHKTNRIK